MTLCRIRTSLLAATIALLAPASALGDVSILAYHHVSNDTPVDEYHARPVQRPA